MLDTVKIARTAVPFAPSGGGDASGGMEAESDLALNISTFVMDFTHVFI